MWHVILIRHAVLSLTIQWKENGTAIILYQELHTNLPMCTCTIKQFYVATAKTKNVNPVQYIPKLLCAHVTFAGMLVCSSKNPYTTHYPSKELAQWQGY